jgi:hypothetical protein
MMSQAISPGTQKVYELERVCRMWEACRSSFYSRQKKATKHKRGPKPIISDNELLGLIKEDLAATPFKGEGHRKVHARLKPKPV